jgi:ATP-dependent helicase/nuclease subunit B
LSECLTCLAEVLAVSGAAESLAADAAGQAVLAALRLPAIPGQAMPEPDPMWLRVAASTRMRLRDLARWVDQTLEAANFMPAPGAEQADLIITPLTRAVLRPFAAVLLPGADEAQLGARGGDGWLPAAHAQALGLSTQTVQQQGQWEAFAVLATHPQVIALSRHVRDGEPVAPSTWVTRWSLSAGWPLGQDLWPEPASCLHRLDVEFKPEARPQPGLPPRGSDGEPADALWPAQVSASSYERLRQCPYRFFALSLLGLKPLDELEEGLERQDHGTWLHAVLKRFHDDRPAELAPQDPAQDLGRWMAVALEVAREHGLLAAGQSAYFLPYQATLERLGTHYIQWLRQHEGQGWRVIDMEVTRELMLPLQEGGAKLKLHGQLDRIDRWMGAEGGQRRVMDYKTGSMSGLKAKLAEPLEDTQLAFYALLSGDDEQAPDVQASYLHIDDRACTDLPHPEVMASAQALHDGVIHDFQRIWQGQGMPPLGEGAVCDYCEARGLCRKDHWGPGSQA